MENSPAQRNRNCPLSLRLFLLSPWGLALALFLNSLCHISICVKKFVLSLHLARVRSPLRSHSHSRSLPRALPRSPSSFHVWSLPRSVSVGCESKTRSSALTCALTGALPCTLARSLARSCSPSFFLVGLCHVWSHWIKGQIYEQINSPPPPTIPYWATPATVCTRGKSTTKINMWNSNR